MTNLDGMAQQARVMANFLRHAPDIHTGPTQPPGAPLRRRLHVVKQSDFCPVFGCLLGGGQASTAPADDDEVVGVVVVGGAGGGGGRGGGRGGATKRARRHGSGGEETVVLVCGDGTDEKAGVDGGGTKEKNGEGGVEDEEAADAARKEGRQRSRFRVWETVAKPWRVYCAQYIYARFIIMRSVYTSEGVRHSKGMAVMPYTRRPSHLLLSLNRTRAKDDE